MYVSAMNDIGTVVAAIAVAQTAGRQVEHAREEGHEHIRLIAFAERGVQRLHDARWIGLMSGSRAEECMRHSHHEG